MAKSYYAVILSLFITAVLFQNCSKAKDDSYIYSASATSQNYFKKSKSIIIEVYYEPGAEPFFGNSNNGTQLWNILESNLQAIFQYRSTLPTIIVPKQMNAMTMIPEQNRASWSSMDILELNREYKNGSSTSDQSRFYIYFLKGNFSDEGVLKTNTLGVNIGGTPVIAIFKDVVKSTGTLPNGWVSKYVEQSTLVHEMGHALGFVNNGVPMASPHQDSAHGAHTTNQDCVMYYLNEGATDMAQFVQKYITSQTTILWGPEVLADAQNYSQ